MTPREFIAQAPTESAWGCNLCGERMARQIHGLDRYGIVTTMLECIRCGLHWLSPRMTAEAYAQFYRDGHYRALLTEFYGRPITPQSIESDQKRYAARLTQFLNPHMESLVSGLLLDVGGSTGVVAEHLAYAFNLDATVIEPAEAEAARARDRGLSVAAVPVEEYDAGGNHYDLVTMCRTIDHQLDVRGTLERIRGWVRPGGLFFVDFLQAHATKIDHPYYLTSQTMVRYLKKTGFKVKVLADAGRHVNVLAEVA